MEAIVIICVCVSMLGISTLVKTICRKILKKLRGGGVSSFYK